MKVLIMTMPHIPSYFNAAYNMSIFQVSSYLRKNTVKNEIIAKDISALNFTWKKIASLLKSNEFDLIALMNDYDSIDNLERLMFYISELSPNSALMTFGRLSMQIPDFFRKYKFDFIAYEGDYELNILSVINYLENRDIPKGCYYLESDKYLKGAEITPLSPEEFEFPDISEVPYNDYYKLYKDDSLRYCGIPNRNELVIHASRGCPIGCEFCDVQLLNGKKDRRVSVKRIIEYIKENKREFDYISFFSSIFTLNSKWLYDFCNSMINEGINMPWKCVTTIQNLDINDLGLMKESGCFRIGLGIESLEKNISELLPIEKSFQLSRLESIFSECNKFNIEINAFIMLGLKDETIEGIEETIKFIEDRGGRVRPSLYTPYHKLNNTMSNVEVSQFNRQLFPEYTNQEECYKNQIYNILHRKTFKDTPYV